MATKVDGVAEPDIGDDLRSALEEIQDRVLWLATYIIHYANNVRPSPSGLKVGGHQALSLIHI